MTSNQTSTVCQSLRRSYSLIVSVSFPLHPCTSAASLLDFVACTACASPSVSLKVALPTSGIRCVSCYCLSLPAFHLQHPLAFSLSLVSLSLSLSPCLRPHVLSSQSLFSLFPRRDKGCCCLDSAALTSAADGRHESTCTGSAAAASTAAAAVARIYDRRSNRVIPCLRLHGR